MICGMCGCVDRWQTITRLAQEDNARLEDHLTRSQQFIESLAALQQWTESTYPTYVGTTLAVSEEAQLIQVQETYQVMYVSVICKCLFSFVFPISEFMLTVM